MPLALEELAYAAGFFDGEGHIAITHSKAGKITNKYGKTYFYERFGLHIEVGQKDKTPLVWLKTKFGGTLRHHVCRRSYDKKSYVVWKWTLQGENAVRFLSLINPFLLLKKDEADVAIEFQATIDRKRRRRNSPETMLARQIAFDKIRQIRAVR